MKIMNMLSKFGKCLKWKIWNVTKLHLKCDVLLLVDVFKKFRGVCFEYYRLDLCHYVSTPGWSWDAMLKMASVELNWSSDVYMYQFIEKGMIAGISSVTQRYSEANNEQVECYDKNKLSNFIIYKNGNNLY